MKLRSFVALGALLVGFASCSSDTPKAVDTSAAATVVSTADTSAAATDAPTTTTTAAATPLHILVTNDDGFDAAGIDAIVEYLRTLDNVEVSVVAPATNQSGTGDKSTPGDLVVADVKTLSGYPAKSVAGFPADSVLWAINGGLSVKPDLVVSGSNLGQNYGPFTVISGTVGAAATAARNGIPGIAISQGTAVAPATPYFPASVTVLTEYLADTLASYRDGTAKLLVAINVPTCPVETTLFPTLVAPRALDANGRTLGAPATCDGPLTADPVDDVDAFNAGHGVVSYLNPTDLTPAAP